MKKNKPKILYYASWNSFTHIGCAYNLAKMMPDVEFHIATAENWPFPSEKNIIYHKLYRPNCAMRIDDKFYLHGYPYEKELANVKKYRKHLIQYLNLVKKINPNLILVDITLEIAIWSKFIGYPVGLFYETFDSNNLRHRLAWDNVDKIFVRYPKNLIEQIENSFSSRMSFVGGLSKFELIKKLPDTKECMKQVGLKNQDRKMITIICSSHSHNTYLIRKYYKTIAQAANKLANNYDVFMFYPKDDDLAKILKKQYKKVHFIIGIFNRLQHYLPLSEIVITGSGLGATMDSAFFRTPMVVIPAPWLISEQMIKARALENIGAARSMDPVDISARTIVSEVESLMEDKVAIASIKETERQLVDKRGYQRLASGVYKMLRSSASKSRASVLNE